MQRGRAERTGEGRRHLGGRERGRHRRGEAPPTALRVSDPSKNFFLAFEFGGWRHAGPTPGQCSRSFLARFGEIRFRGLRPLPALGDLRSPVTFERRGLELSLMLRWIRLTETLASVSHVMRYHKVPRRCHLSKVPKPRQPFSSSLENLRSRITLQRREMELRFNSRRIRLCETLTTRCHTRVDDRIPLPNFASKVFAPDSPGLPLEDLRSPITFEWRGLEPRLRLRWMRLTRTHAAVHHKIPGNEIPRCHGLS